MTHWTKSLADAAADLGLKKQGSEYKGPCPVCGGNDRFWLAKGQKHDILATCRHGCGFGDIAKVLLDMGLIERDSDYKRPVYDQATLDQADFAVLVAESDLKQGKPIQAHDRRFIASLIGRVDQARQSRLMAVLEQMRASYE